ncbi:hypothetical protein DPX16_23886 [Anabarilius grahami]|uniref:Uncharacterized protein n=1 Tax=Anabarilius grahami TaxID=495550 RepID=A0A3N0YR03_ANAGA|nr:hypothetical protein DPX16_23886 [Anabarilius grahami]
MKRQIQGCYSMPAVTQHLHLQPGAKKTAGDTLTADDMTTEAFNALSKAPSIPGGDFHCGHVTILLYDAPTANSTQNELDRITVLTDSTRNVHRVDYLTLIQSVMA